MERSLLFLVIAPLVAVGFMIVLFGILQQVARQRGKSILRDLGSRGWVIAIQVAAAAGCFSGIVINALVAPENVPPTWIPVLVYGLIFGPLGLAAFRNAWRETIRSLAPRGGGLLSDAQKG